MSSTHLALPRRSQRVGTIIPGPVISLDVWYQTVISQVYVIYGEHWLYDITQWYQRFILWYQGLDSDICGLLVSNNNILFCLLSMISIVKKKKIDITMILNNSKPEYYTGYTDPRSYQSLICSDTILILVINLTGVLFISDCDILSLISVISKELFY